MSHYRPNLAIFCTSKHTCIVCAQTWTAERVMKDLDSQEFTVLMQIQEQEE